MYTHTHINAHAPTYIYILRKENKKQDHNEDDNCTRKDRLGTTLIVVQL